MNRWLTALVLLTLPTQPAFADKLTVAEVYRKFEGDWVSVPEGDSAQTPCQSTVIRRFSLDVDGYELSIRDLQQDGSVLREFKYRLLAIPAESDMAPYLELFGPEVDRSKGSLVWRQQLSISMTDPDHLYAYFGYAAWPDSTRDFVDIVPHGFGGDMLRCR